MVRIQGHRLQSDERCRWKLVRYVGSRLAVGRVHYQVVVFVQVVAGNYRVAHTVAGRCSRVGAAHAHHVEQVLLFGLGDRLLLGRRVLLVLIAW